MIPSRKRSAIPEILELDGEEIPMFTAPWISRTHPRIRADEVDMEPLVHGPRISIGRWRLEHGKLFLVAVQGECSIAGEGPVFADWFSDYIVIPRGEPRPYDIRKRPWYAHHEYLQFENGELVETWVVDRRPGAEQNITLFSPFMRSLAALCRQYKFREALEYANEARDIRPLKKRPAAALARRVVERLHDHSARTCYWINDDAWTMAARHARGEPFHGAGFLFALIAHLEWLAGNAHPRSTLARGAGIDPAMPDDWLDQIKAERYFPHLLIRCYERVGDRDLADALRQFLAAPSKIRAA